MFVSYLNQNENITISNNLQFIEYTENNDNKKGNLNDHKIENLNDKIEILNDHKILAEQDYKKDLQNQTNLQKPYLWIYWENKPGFGTPAYINLCMKSIYKHCSQSFNIIKLDQNNIYEYLPELSFNNINLSKLLIAQKVDYYRVLLLYKYGGLYIDADTLVLRDPIEIIHKLKLYDYVGFGCTGINCNYGYGKPSNGIMASRSNGILITRILNNIEAKLKNTGNNNDNKQWDYFDLGKLIIWQELEYLINNENYQYYHYSNDYDGTRDVDGNWIETSYLFSDKYINYKHIDKMFFIILYNSQMEDLRKLTEEEILNSNYNISKYFKKSLSN